MQPDYCEGCNQRFAPIDQQSCWGCKDGDCNTSKRGLLNAAMKKKIEQLDGGVVALCETYSQVNKALCGKENATPSELLQAVSQLKSRLAQVERERDALMYYAKGCCTTCAFRDDCAKHDLNDSSPYGARWYYGDCEDWEWRGVCEGGTKEES